MALNGQSTSNYNLYKPSLQDSPPDITSTNANWDTIDNELKKLRDDGLPSLVNNKLPTSVSTGESKTIYLSPDGNDSNSGFTSLFPMKKISTAIARYGGTKRLYLYLAEGLYMETTKLTVSGCEAIIIKGTGSAKSMIDCTYEQIGGIFEADNIHFSPANLSTDDTLTFNGVSVSITNCEFVSGVSALVFRNGSIGIVSTCDFINSTRAIWALNGSYVAATSITGAFVQEAYRTTASIITVGTSTIEATTLAAKYGGGVIFRGGNLIGSTANTFVNATT